MQHGQTFHSAMRPILLLFQVIGVFPVYGILREDPQKLRFRWLTTRTFFSMFIILIGLMMSYIEYERLTRVGGVNTQSIIGIIFYLDTVFSIMLLLKYLDLALKLAWACHDLMIVLTSIGISFYFREIYQRVQPFGNGITIANEKFWIEIRSQYVLLCEFVKEANNYLALVIIHSCCKNLYLMCFELIKVVRKEQSTASRIHHWCSLIYLIIKTTMVFYNTAMISETAKAPLVVCKSIPNKGWCSELQRYIAQLRSDQVAYTGIGFFRLTKRTMLAMVGTVISYQLVMLKVAEDTKGIGDVEPCSKLAFSRD